MRKIEASGNEFIEQREIAGVNLYKSFFKNPLPKSHQNICTPSSFYTDGSGCSIQFKYKENHTNKYPKLDKEIITDTIAGWDLGHKSTIFSVERKLNGYSVMEKGVYDYYLKTMIRDANFNLDIFCNEYENGKINRINKTFPSLKTHKNTELLNGIRYIGCYLKDIMDFWKQSPNRNWRFRKYVYLRRYLDKLVNKFKAESGFFFNLFLHMKSATNKILLSSLVIVVKN